MSDSRHILTVLEDAMRDLAAGIRRMAGLAEENLALAVRGLLDRDNRLCDRVIAEDSIVDDLEKRIDQLGHDLILRFAPVSEDLRRVIASMKVSAALERISDHAVTLARRAREINQSEPVGETALIQPIYELAAAQLKQAVDCFSNGDPALAARVAQGDDPLDIAHYQFIERLTENLGSGGPRAKNYLSLIFIARALERVGDQAVNIAEDTIYLLTAQDVRHGGETPAPNA